MVTFATTVRDGESPVCGIYAIVNTVNGRRYIGSSVHIVKRWRDHVWELTQQKIARRSVVDGNPGTLARSGSMKQMRGPAGAAVERPMSRE